MKFQLESPDGASTWTVRDARLVAYYRKIEGETDELGEDFGPDDVERLVAGLPDYWEDLVWRLCVEDPCITYADDLLVAVDERGSRVWVIHDMTCVAYERPERELSERELVTRAILLELRDAQ